MNNKIGKPLPRLKKEHMKTSISNIKKEKSYITTDAADIDIKKIT